MTTTPGRGDVFAEERQDHIARIVEEHGRARVADLASTFRVSGVTIRKDLAVLERQGRVVRTHGGAVTPGRAGAERAFDVRERLQRRREGRDRPRGGRHGRRRREHRPRREHDRARPARHLKGRGGWLHLTVITNGLRIAAELAGHPGHQRRRCPPASSAGRRSASSGRWARACSRRSTSRRRSWAPPASRSRPASATRPRRRRRSSASWSRARARSSASSTTRSGSGPRSRRSAETADIGVVVTDAGAPPAMVEEVRRTGVEVHLVERTTDRDVGRSRQIRTGGSAPW